MCSQEVYSRYSKVDMNPHIREKGEDFVLDWGSLKYLNLEKQTELDKQIIF